MTSGHYRSLHRLPLPLLALLSVGACGGGGDEPITPPQPLPETVTLTGVVTDAPIAAATVLARIGTQEVSAQADDQGAYSLTIEIDDAPAGELVVLEATGSSQQPGVRLISIAGTVADLDAAAGEDDALSSSEDLALNVTNLSTAKYALLSESNGAPIADAAAVVALEPMLDGAELLRRAAAIKLVVDNPMFSLPDGVEDTLALVSDAGVVAEFIDQAGLIDPTALDAAIQQILVDRTVVSGFAPQDSPVSYALLSGYKSFYESATVIHLEADGRGTYVAQSGDDGVSWAVEDGELALMFDTGFPFESFDFVPVPGNPGGQVRAIHSLLDQRCVILDAGTASAPLRCRTVRLTTYPDNPDLPEEIVESEGYPMMALTRFDFDPAALEGRRWTMPGSYDTLPEPARNQHAILAFRADTLGENEVSAEGFNWEVDEGALTATYGDGETYTYQRVLPFGPGHYTLVSRSDANGQRTVNVALAMPLDETLAFAADTMSGRYDNRGQHELVYRLDADGTGAVVSIFQDGSSFESPITAWTVVEGLARLERPSPSWVRTWAPVQQQGDRTFLYEHIQFPGGESYRRISFVDKAPL